MAASNGELEPLISPIENHGDEIHDHHDPEENRHPGSSQIPSKLRLFIHSNVLIPLTVGAPYRRPLSRNDEDGPRKIPVCVEVRGDGMMSSALLLLITLALRGPLLAISFVFKEYPHTAILERSINGWLILQEMPLLWVCIAIILQLLVCIGTFREWRWFQKQEHHQALDHDPFWHLLGIGVFGIGTLILYSTIIYDHSQCIDKGGKQGLYHILEMVYYTLCICFALIQFTYVYLSTFKTYKIDNHPTLRYAFMYISACNVMYSFYYAGSEVREAIVDSESGVAFCGKLHNTSKDKIVSNMYRYFFSFCIEFNLMVVEIMLHKWGSMSCLGNLVATRATISSQSGVPVLVETNSEYSYFISGMLATGAPLLLAIYGRWPSQGIATSFIIFNFIRDAFIIIAILLGFNCISEVSKPKKYFTSASVILFCILGLGNYFLKLLLFIAKLVKPVSGINLYPAYLSVLDLIQIWFQTTYLIFIQGNKPPTCERKMKVLKHVTIYLGIYNFVRWAEVSYFTLNVGDKFQFAKDLYGPIYATFLIYTLVPITIFYYFQCAMFLANYFVKITGWSIYEMLYNRWVQRGNQNY